MPARDSRRKRKLDFAHTALVPLLPANWCAEFIPRKLSLTKVLELPPKPPTPQTSE